MTSPSAAATFDCLAALSVVLDLANGLAVDKSLVTAAFAWDLSRDTGCDDEDQLAAVLAALLRHLGCTAFASVEASVAGDDIALRGALHRSDSSRPLDVVRAVSGARGAGLAGAGSALGVVTNLASLRRSLTSEACGAARVLSDELKLGPKVRRALDEVFERVDGTGAPHGWAGAELSMPGRVATVAHVAVVFALEGGVDEARRVLTKRSGSVLDAALVKRAQRLVSALAPSCADFLAARHEALRAFVASRGLPTDVDALSRAFGDFADLQVPMGRGHSRRVAALAERAGRSLGFSATDVSLVVRAAHLHDLGQVAVPTSIWTTSRAWRPTELERARTHVYFTERVLSAAAPLTDVAQVASAHHERLDGTGYHRQSTGAALARPARLLAACDVVSAVLEARPHRPARGLDAAAAVVRAEARGGRLDEACVEAALAAAGARATTPTDSLTLSARELEVLRLLATGQTNKQIAAALGISARTVQHHTIHIYEKLGVDTRAGAAVVASQRGLLA